MPASIGCGDDTTPMLTTDAGPSDGGTDSTVADAAGEVDSNTPDGLANDASVADASRAEAADASDASVADGAANDASVAEDAAGEGGSDASVADGATNSADASRTKVIFVTASTENGNLSRPIAGDTAVCPYDAHKPAGTASYKVILVDSQDQTRVACSNPNCAGDAGSQHVDWALAPNTTYARPDGTVIGTTTSGAIFAFPLQNPISASNVTVWTGLNADWTTNANTCGGWLTSSGMGVVGAANQVDSTSIAMASVTCTMQGSYYCVEQ
ncbi:MAG TPA: DUF1554 domain-containing protein [Polyangiaceae bacterium]|nr:DUF1554 domain-containing protein [Polyangiaceae bacterium]